MSSEEKVRVTVEACGEVRSLDCRCATVSTTDLDARREISDMAAELGVYADL